MTLDELSPTDHGLAVRWISTGAVRGPDLVSWLKDASAEALARRGGLAEWLSATGRLRETQGGGTVLTARPTTDRIAPSEVGPMPSGAGATVLHSVVQTHSDGTILDADPHAATAGSSNRAPGAAPRTVGRFEIQGLLGRGGMGVVYRAWDPQMQRPVAVKLLGAADRDDAEMIDRFLREAQTAGSLRHPGIVAIYETGTHEEAPYAAMELVDGQPLDEAVREGAWSLRDRVSLFRDLARAVAHAHAHRVIHRDLKPANVLVTPDRRPCVLDFGLARRMDAGRNLTATGQMMGTPGYMPPEQIEGDPARIGPHCDVFALGAMFYELLTGRAPIQGQTQMELITRTLAGRWPPPRRIEPGLPPDLETLCLKSLEPEIERRYPNAAALADDVDRWLAGESILARPPAAGDQALRFARKHKAAVAALLLLVSGAGGGLAWFRWRHADAVASALDGARRSRAEARASDARDGYRRVLDLEPAHEEAGTGAAWAEDRIRRAQEEAEQAKRDAAASREALRKSGLVGAVLARWGLLLEPLRRMEAAHHDPTIDAEERRRRAGPAWRRVERFMNQTPADPTAQSTMYALAGFARRLAGFEEEGLAWMAKARELDPDLPYGALVEAMVHFGRLVAEQDLPTVTYRVTGIEFEPAPPEPEPLRKVRAAMEERLAEVAKAAVWGGGLAEEFRTAAEGMRDMHGERYAQAAEAFTAVLGSGLQAFRSDLLFARARAFFLCKRFTEAVEDLEEVREARPESAEVWFQLAWFRSAIALEAAPKGGDARDVLRAAVVEYGEAVKRKPGWEWALRSRAMALQDLAKAEAGHGDDPRETLAAALRDFAAAATVSPREVLTHHNCGIARLALADARAARGEDARDTWRAAAEDFTRALECDPGYLFSYGSRGAVWKALGDFEDGHGEDPMPSYRRAIADFEEALGRDPGLVDIRHNRAIALHGLGEAEEARGADPRGTFHAAVAEFAEVLGRQPEHVPARNSLGITLLSLGSAEEAHAQDGRPLYAKAIEALGEALKRNPEYVLAYDARGVARRHLALAEAARGGDPRPGLEEAVRDHAEALRRNPAYAYAHHNLGQAWVALAEAAAARREDPREAYGKAIAGFDGALVQNPEGVVHHHSRGDALRALGEAEAALGGDAAVAYGAAVAAFSAALERAPRYVRAWNGRAVAHFRWAALREGKGDDPRAEYARAAEDFGEVDRLDPEGLGNLAYRGIACELLARAETARDGDAAPRFAEALADYEARLKTRPRDMMALARRVLLLRDTGRTAEARAACDAALREYPEDATLRTWREELGR